MKTYIISYWREIQIPNAKAGLSFIENARVEELFKGNVLQSFYLNKEKTKAWLIVKVPSKFDVLELDASFQLLRPDDVEMQEVFD